MVRFCESIFPRCLVVCGQGWGEGVLKICYVTLGGGHSERYGALYGGEGVIKTAK